MPVARSVPVRASFRRAWSTRILLFILHPNAPAAQKSDASLRFGTFMPAGLHRAAGAVRAGALLFAMRIYNLMRELC
jgi:hypothetical protein